MVIPEAKFCSACGCVLEDKFLEGRMRKWCSICKEIAYCNPLPVVACILTLDEGRSILLVKRAFDPKKGFWCLPGGYVEYGESTPEAAAREFKEETNLGVEATGLAAVVSSDGPTWRQIIVLGYFVSATGSLDAIKAGDDAKEVRSFPFDDLPEIAFRTHSEIIDAGRRLIAKHGPEPTGYPCCDLGKFEA